VTSDCFDLVVIGSGPAGTAAALTAAARGWRVCVVSCSPVSSTAGAAPASPTSNGRVGESLAPAARSILSQLGLWSRFEHDRHAPCYGNASAWGETRLRHHDALLDPRGHGWHLDRRRFDSGLEQGLDDAGIRRYSAVVGTSRRQRNRWQLGVRRCGSAAPVAGALPAELHSPWVIDASGRGAAFVRRHGAHRLQHDKQQALVAWLSPGDQPMADSSSLVETVPEGWWYSAPLPGGHLVAALFTEPGRPWQFRRDPIAGSGGGRSGRHHERCPPDTGLLEWWQHSLQASHHTAARLRHYRWRMDSGQAPRRYASGSSRLQRFSGDGWLAAGDAWRSAAAK